VDVLGTGRERERGREQPVDTLDRRQGALLETPRTVRVAQRIADLAPVAFVDLRRGGTIGDDLDGVVGQQHVQQHAVVGLGVPDAGLREHLERTIARRSTSKDVAQRQRRFDRHAQLGMMLALAAFDRRLDPLQRGIGEGAPRAMRAMAHVPVRACDRSRPRHLGHHPPDAPPPPKPPPPPRKPPPPNPPRPQPPGNPPGPERQVCRPVRPTGTPLENIESSPRKRKKPAAAASSADAPPAQAATPPSAPPSIEPNTRPKIERTIRPTTKAPSSSATQSVPGCCDPPRPSLQAGGSGSPSIS